MFGKVMDLAVVAAYGGSGVKEQINGLKRGAHIVACTPGRMIDILVTSNGSITNLRRVTMLVIDEADRMFDMGFEPQISRIIGQIRPDRQTVLFSATFPRQVEILARAILTDPIEVQVRLGLVHGFHARFHGRTTALRTLRSPGSSLRLVFQRLHFPHAVHAPLRLLWNYQNISKCV